VNFLHLPSDGEPGEDRLGIRARALPDEDRQRYESYLAEIFEALGMKLDTPGTRGTPHRFLRALIDATAGYDGDPKLVTVFPSESLAHGASSGQVIEGPIAFYSLCEHHAMPFFGRAYVGYIPRDQIIGISKLTRLVRLFAMRFSVQERIGEEVASSLVEILDARGVAVHLDAVHLCTQMRGVRDSETRTQTTSWRGDFESGSDLQDQFLRLTQGHL